jgi:hypothetical protein
VPLVYGFRVRGIYATAIAKILIDSGFKPSDISEKLSMRLGAEGEGYVDVTVKNGEHDKGLLVIVGIPSAVEEAFKAISGVLRRSLYRGPLPLYMVFRTSAISQESSGCYVETPLGVNGFLRDKMCYKGEEMVATIIGYRDDGIPIIDRGIYVVGRHMILLDKPVQRVSEHIKDPDVILELKGVSDMILRQGLGVSWRSSASRASTKELLEEFEELRKNLALITSQAREKPRLEPLYLGEEIAFIQLSPDDMEELDGIRSMVIPTAPMHHIIKAYSDHPETADLLDGIVASGGDPDIVRKGIRKHILENLYEGAEVHLIHGKPFEKPLILGKGRLRIYIEDGGKIFIGILRNIAGPGIYDGLGIPKEREDKAFTVVGEDTWLLIHAYYAKDAKLKGIYVNINTKPIFIYDGSLKIRYLDLELDASITEQELRIIDEKPFEAICRKPAEICEKARNTMEKVRERYKEIWGIMSNMGREILARVDDEKDPALEKFKNLINILTSISYLSYH